MFSPGVKVGDIVTLKSAEECIESFERHHQYVWDAVMDKGMCGNSFEVLGIDESGPWVAVEVPMEIQLNARAGYGHFQGKKTWWFHEDAFDTSYDRLVRKYSMLMLKMLGGMVKFVFEDCLHSFCQLCYLIKEYHDMMLSARAFTICSILCALLVSISGPILEFIQARRLKAQVADASRLNVLTKQQVPDGYDMLQHPISSQDVSLDVTREHRPVDMDPDDFIVQKSRHAKAAHALLVFASILYWLSMGVMPFVFHGSFQCGGSVSAKQLLYFIVVVAGIHLIELHVMVQTLEGYIFFRSYLDRVLDLLSCKTDRLMGTMSFVLSILAKFDTFTDVTFTMLLCQCKPITWVSIKGVVIHLPCELHKIAVFGLVVGVFAMQAAPGVALLALKKQLPIALQLNEFRTLLALVADRESRKQDEALQIAKAKLSALGS